MDFLIWKTSYSSLQIQTFGTIKIICSRQAKFNQTVVNYFLIKKIEKPKLHGNEHFVGLVVVYEKTYRDHYIECGGKTELNKI